MNDIDIVNELRSVSQLGFSTGICDTCNRAAKEIEN